MSTYKSYIYILMFKLNNDNQSEIVSFNIENIMLIANAICCPEGGLNVREVGPMALTGSVMPILKSFLSLGMFKVIVNQGFL